MVHVLNPVVIEYANADIGVPTPVKIPQPSIEKMRKQIVDTIRQFLVNPEQCVGPATASNRFWGDEKEENIYIDDMAMGFQDWFHDTYDFVVWDETSDRDKNSIIYYNFRDSLKNAIDIFGKYAVEQQAIYIAGSLFTTIKPIGMDI